MSEGDTDGVVSLQEVLEEDQHLEDTANAVLGDSDDTQCTYPKVLTCTILLQNKVLPSQMVHLQGYCMRNEKMDNIAKCPGRN